MSIVLGSVTAVVSVPMFCFVDLNERQAAPLPELLLKVGEPLLIRCRALYRNYKFRINLSFENKDVQQVREKGTFKKWVILGTINDIIGNLC